MNQSKMRTFSRIAVVGLLAVTAMGLSAYSQVEGDTEPSPPAFLGVSPLRGVNLPIRGVDEEEVTEKTRRIPMEAFFDEDYGTLNYVTPSGGVASLPFPNDFEFRTGVIDEVVEVVRVSVLRGTVWRMSEEEWVMIEESNEDGLPVGNYDVKILSADHGVVILRFDRRSGSAWYLDDNEWVPVVEEE